MPLKRIPTESGYRVEVASLGVPTPAALKRYISASALLGIPMSQRHKFRFVWDINQRSDLKDDLTIYTPEELSEQQVASLSLCIDAYLAGHQQGLEESDPET